MNPLKLIWLRSLILLLSCSFFVSASITLLNDVGNAGTEVEQESLENQSGMGEDGDLSEWHPQYQERCYFNERENITNKNIETIESLLELLKKEPRISNYLLSIARDLNTVICIDERDDETRGYYDFRYNIVCIKEHLGLFEKLIIFVHELQHIAQFTRGFYCSLDYDIEEIIRMNFAIEADVQAIVTLYAWRMKENDMNEVWNALKGFPRYSDIAEAFEKEIQRSRDEMQAARAAFVQWYSSDWRVDKYYKNTYSWYVDMLDETKILQKYQKLPENYFSKLCMLPCGKNYGCHMTDEIEEKPRITLRKAGEYKNYSILIPKK